MRICIIGSGGLVGSRLSEELSANHETIALNRVSGDVVNMDVDVLARQLGHIDCIVNCAAVMDQSDVANLLATNAYGALNVAKLSVLLKAKLIHLSSVSCEQHSENEYFGTYGISKLTGELLVKDYLESKGSEYCVVRCSQIYDLDGKAHGSQPLFYNLLANANKNGKVTLYGNKNVMRNYVSLETVIKSIRYISENKVEPFGYILGKNISMTEFIDKISESLDEVIEVKWDKDKESLKTIYIPKTCCNFSRQFETNLIDDIKEIIAREAY